MTVLKAFGPTGFQTFFYQKYWRIEINVVTICSHNAVLVLKKIKILQDSLTITPAYSTFKERNKKNPFYKKKIIIN